MNNKTLYTLLAGVAGFFVGKMMFEKDCAKDCTCGSNAALNKQERENMNNKILVALAGAGIAWWYYSCGYKCKCADGKKAENKKAQGETMKNETLLLLGAGLFLWWTMSQSAELRSPIVANTTGLPPNAPVNSQAGAGSIAAQDTSLCAGLSEQNCQLQIMEKAKTEREKAWSGTATTAIKTGSTLLQGLFS